MPEILELDEPVTIAGGVVAQLMLREPTAMELHRAYRHVDAARHPEAVARFASDLVSSVTGTKIEVVHELPEAVIVEASSRIIDLMDRALEGFDAENAGSEIDLEEPLVVNNIGYSSVSVRPPKAGEMIKARTHLRQSQGEAAAMNYRMSLVTQVSGLPPQVVHLLPASVVFKATAAIEFFTVRGRRTGTS